MGDSEWNDDTTCWLADGWSPLGPWGPLGPHSNPNYTPIMAQPINDKIIELACAASEVAGDTLDDVGDLVQDLFNDACNAWDYYHGQTTGQGW